ncbi:hypothetical protein TNCT_255731 [Trichonephila clavata]|uniref:Uncharacterized protein n=1 Tax=Trichonephila clavata TaxID=2740835 RepID=A0A8X6F053_TRICU|nr:hypothetical protein TNCT_255731 [Trichonephila clavata]
MRLKLDQILDLANRYGIEIRVMQETKLKKHSVFKVHNYSVYCMDKARGGGGGPVLLIQNLKFYKIVTPVQGSNLKLQDISVVWKKKII